MLFEVDVLKTVLGSKDQFDFALEEGRPFSQLPLPGVSCCDVSSSVTGKFSNFREYYIGSVKLSHFDSRISRFTVVGEDNVLQHIMHSCLGRTGSGISDIVRTCLNR